MEYNSGHRDRRRVSAPQFGILSVHYVRTPRIDCQIQIAMAAKELGVHGKSEFRAEPDTAPFLIWKLWGYLIRLHVLNQSRKLSGEGEL